ncbi:MAG: hypothetical protein J6V40_00135 [Clostridia bacterium]|nr:hypothetical protein [Clostridia bacterium]
MSKEYFYKMREFFVDKEKTGHIPIEVQTNKDMYTDYYRPVDYEDYFYVYYKISTVGSDSSVCYEEYIDSYDSFVFGIYFTLYTDGKIVVTDYNRTWECGVTEAESSGLVYKHFDKYKALVEKYGFYLEQETCIMKDTNIDTFVDDAITLTKVMLMLNYIQDKPPYIKYNKQIRKDINRLIKDWKEDRV